MVWILDGRIQVLSWNSSRVFCSFVSCSALLFAFSLFVFVSFCFVLCLFCFSLAGRGGGGGGGGSVYFWFVFVLVGPGALAMRLASDHYWWLLHMNVCHVFIMILYGHEFASCLCFVLWPIWPVLTLLSLICIACFVLFFTLCCVVDWFSDGEQGGTGGEGN